MKTIAMPVVRRVRKFPAPLLPKIVELLPPNTAPISAPLPCCNNTTPTRNKHATMCTIVTMVPMLTSRRKFRDPHERFDLQARPTHQRAVDVRLPHQCINIIRLHTSAIQDSTRTRPASYQLDQCPSNECVHRLRLLRRGDLARPDGPHGLVGDDQSGYSSCIPTEQSVAQLPAYHRQCLLGFALLERLAHTDDRDQSAGLRARHLLRYALVGLAEELAALRVADDDMRAPDVTQHQRRHLAGERTLGLTVRVLPR